MHSLVRALGGVGRSLLRRRRTSAYTLVLLAIGVGLPTAMFSLLDGVILRGLPFPSGDRIVRVTTLGEGDTAVPAGDFEALSGAVGTMSEEGHPALEEIAGGLSLTTVVTLFAAASLVLSGFGLFGVAVLSLRRRGRELAIRSALGARPAALRGLLVRQGLGWIGFGLAGGVALSWIVHRMLRAFLHGIEPWDPVLITGATALVVLALSAAVLGPARRAARTDPAAVLDAE